MLLAAARILDPNASVNWLLGNADVHADALTEQFDMIVCAPPLGTMRRRRHFDGVARPVFDNESHLLIPHAGIALSEDGIGVFVVSSHFLLDSRKDSVRHRLSDFGLSLNAYVSVPPQDATFRYAVGLAFVRKGQSDDVFTGILSAGNKLSERMLGNLLSRVDGGSVTTGRIVTTEGFVSPEKLYATERVNRMADRLGIQPRRLDEVTRVIKSMRNHEPSELEERTDAVYLPLHPIGRAVTDIGHLETAHRYAVLLLNVELADPRYVASFLNSSTGRTIREAGTGRYGPMSQLSLPQVHELAVFLPNMDCQLRIIETDSRAVSLMNELGELRQDLWQRPLAERRVRELLDGVNRSETFSNWLDALPFPLASILWAYHAAGGKDTRQYQYLDHFFEALSAFVATLALSAFRADPTLYDREWPIIRDSLHTQSLSLRRATMGTWIAVAERLCKRARAMLNGEQADDCLRAFCTADRTVLDALLSKDLVTALKKANTMRNDWRGHGGIVGSRKAYQLRVILFDLLTQLRTCLGTVWTRYRLVRARHMRMVDDGTYEVELEDIMGRSYPFRSLSATLEQPLRHGQLYFLGEAESRALPLLPFVTLHTSPDDAQNACYFYNRVDGQEIRLVSYHYESEPELQGAFADTLQILDELSP